MPIPSFKTETGLALPLGPTSQPEGVNFALFSRNATQVSLLFFETGQEKHIAEIKLDPTINRTGDIWHILVLNLDPNTIRYGYRVDGPFDPTGKGHYFSPENILIDPYAKALTGGTQWGIPYHRQGLANPISTFQRRCCIVDNHFDWEGDRPLNIPLKDTIIYELHVRGFTKHSSSQVEHPGTYQGIVEKIPYLKKLGITAVELLPVTEFNEHENINQNPETNEKLKNLWGYSPISFFAPKAGYATNGSNGNQVREFKEMVKALHKAGIEVILDVVVNHTAEAGSDGPIISFRGLDNTIYYLLDPETRDFLNFSGCGNTVNCNHPLVRHLIMDSLRFWVMEMHVDGFRFDLASVLGRDQQGNVLSNPPMVEKIAEDPILAHTKIIAEAWDAAGLYQVGSFSTHHRWAEWNGKYRDDVRRFLCGQNNTVADLATRLAGSADLYQPSGRKPYNSINFITSHDGFTLYDLVSYNEKHNELNGEDSRDGENFNISWNSGCEGPTDDPAINALRKRRICTFATILFISQGPPMFAAGDEFGRTQQGNNNAYCQDNEISWINWELAQTYKNQLRFFTGLIKLRKKHPVFRRSDFFPEEKQPEIEWFSRHGTTHDWQPHNKTLCLMLYGSRNKIIDDDFYIMFNVHHNERSFSIPKTDKEKQWHQIVNTGEASPADICDEKNGIVVADKITVAGMGAVILIANPKS